MVIITILNDLYFQEGACVWIHHHFVDLFMTPEAGVKINSARFVPSSFTMSKFTYVKLWHKAKGGKGKA